MQGAARTTSSAPPTFPLRSTILRKPRSFVHSHATHQRGRSFLSRRFPRLNLLARIAEASFPRLEGSGEARPFRFRSVLTRSANTTMWLAANWVADALLSLILDLPTNKFPRVGPTHLLSPRGGTQSSHGLLPNPHPRSQGHGAMRMNTFIAFQLRSGSVTRYTLPQLGVPHGNDQRII